MAFNGINTNNAANNSQAALNKLIEQLLTTNPNLAKDWNTYRLASNQLYNDMCNWQTSKPDPATVNADLAAMQQALAQVVADAQGWSTLVNMLAGYNTGSPSPMSALENDIASGNATGNYGYATWDIASGGPVGSLDDLVYALIQHG